jgi:hypothetical protein
VHNLFGKVWWLSFPLVGAVPMVLLVLLATPLCIISPFLSPARRRYILELLHMIVCWAVVLSCSGQWPTDHSHRPVPCSLLGRSSTEATLEDRREFDGCPVNGIASGDASYLACKVNRACVPRRGNTG